MQDEKIKEAFEKVKTDIFQLGNEITFLNNEIINIKDSLNSIHHLFNTLKQQQINQQNVSKLAQNDQNSTNITISTDNKDFSTHPANSTDTSTDNSAFQGLKYPNNYYSTGNEGVSTDRQTDRQTDKSTQEYAENEQNRENIQNNLKNPTINQTISQASEIIQNLDAVKKEVRKKFKSITQQEMLVFSTIYQLEEQNVVPIEYYVVANKLGLSQSSIRDYIQRLIDKGIPIVKTKVNNKKINLSISKDLKSIVSLSTILKLREI